MDPLTKKNVFNKKGLSGEAGFLKLCNQNYTARNPIKEKSRKPYNR